MTDSACAVRGPGDGVAGDGRPADSSAPRPDLAFAVTTAARPRSVDCETARGLAADIGCAYVPRGHGALAHTAARAARHGLIVVERAHLTVWIAGRRFRYHPGMARLRVLALQQGNPDALVTALGISLGARVLDCTCGLGADSIVASHVAGPAGRVRALEASPLLALLVARGIATNALDTPPEIAPAMRRVDVCRADFADYLRREADNAWDVVYFDPMFNETIAAAQGLDLVRRLARPGGPSPADLHAARRVARRRVVMKDRRPGRQLERLGFSTVHESRRVCYGALPAFGAGNDEAL